MTRDQVLELLQYRLGDHAEMPARAMLELPLIQQDALEGNSWYPWFLEKDSTGLVTVAQQRTIDLPLDFLGEKEGQNVWITVDGVQLRLVQQDFDTALARYPEVGQPKCYARGVANIALFPLPDAVYQIDMKYYGTADSIAGSSGETPWLKYASDLVIALLGEQLAAKHLQNAAMAQDFKEDVQKAWTRLYHRHVAITEVNTPRSMGGNS